MNLSCDHYCELLATELRQSRPWSEGLEGHLARCAACAALAKARVRQVKAMGALECREAPTELEGRVLAGMSADSREHRASASLKALGRYEAPADLQGRVVAALNSGARGERAVAQLRATSGVAAPLELDRRLETLFAELRSDHRLPECEAPLELEERVDQDLADLERSTVARCLAKLPRLTAPDQLSLRVEDETGAPSHRAAEQDGARSSRTRRFGLVPVSRRIVAAGLASAAGLALWIGLGGLPASEAAPYSFEVQVVQDATGLAPQARRRLGDLGAAWSTEALATRAGSRSPASDLASQAGGGQGGNGGSQSGTSPVGSSAPSGPSQAASGARRAPLGAPTQLTSQGQLFVGTAPPLFDQISGALERVSVRGIRRVLLRQETGEQVSYLEFTEELATDGQGGFTVAPHTVVDPPLDGLDLEYFQLLQHGREGHVFRSRDFSIRDRDRFWANYKVVQLGGEMTVAGLTVPVFDISRTDSSGTRYRVAIDPSTAVVLHQEQLDGNGDMLSSVTFETLTYDPDLSDIELTGGASTATPFALTDAESLGVALLRPTAPPSGFVYERADLVPDPLAPGQRWARLYYTDGVDEVSLSFSADDGARGGSTATSLGKGDLVRVFSFGPWTVAEGRVAGQDAIVVGKVDHDDLLLMLQSALESR